MPSDEPDLAAFGRALAARVKTKQERRELGERVGVGAEAMRLYMLGEREPDRRIVFALERELDLKPGTLSHHLGYVPNSARPTTSIDEAIEASDLSGEARRLLLALYREMRSGG